MENKFELKPSVANAIVDEKGNTYKSARALAEQLGIYKTKITYNLRKKGYFIHEGVKYFAKDTKPINQGTEINYKPREDEAEYLEFRKMKDIESLPFESCNFSKISKDKGYRYAVALFSDAHIEESVSSASVLGLNEYNVEIAENRIKKYFENLCECLNQDNVDMLYFASLGDTISGYIHDELTQCNGMTPVEATIKAQSMLFNGLKFLCENTSLETIKFIGIVGNHSRTTKKIQHANGYKLSYEWLMYQNVKNQCETAGLPIEFSIPESEIALVETPDGKKFIFCHGFQIRGGGNGTVCGIYPALNRLALKWGKVFNQDKIYLGHFHQCVSIANAVVNGSIIGYNSFALANGFAYEEPAQMYEVYDDTMGELLTRRIYCK